jgi:hypothetical protein
VLLQGSQNPVEGRPVTAFGDPPEDREIALDIEVRATAAEVEVAEAGEPPRLVEMEIEDDLQTCLPWVRIASR